MEIKQLSASQAAKKGEVHTTRLHCLQHQAPLGRAAGPQTGDRPAFRAGVQSGSGMPETELLHGSAGEPRQPSLGLAVRCQSWGCLCLISSLLPLQLSWPPGNIQQRLVPRQHQIKKASDPGSFKATNSSPFPPASIGPLSTAGRTIHSSGNQTRCCPALTTTRNSWPSHSEKAPYISPWLSGKPACPSNCLLLSP